MRYFFFFFNDTATTEIYTLSLHDALPILGGYRLRAPHPWESGQRRLHGGALTRGHPIPRAAADASEARIRDRKSTRLNSTHLVISYAVFCLKKNKKRTCDAIHLTPTPRPT